MLEQLSEHIRFCYERSSQIDARAAQTVGPLKSYDLILARWWAHLARSYEYAESVERFLLDADSDAETRRAWKQQAVWTRVAVAPYDRDLRLAVLDADGVAHALVFACRRVLGGWVKSYTKERVDIDPTHWQEWSDDSQTNCSDC